MGVWFRALRVYQWSKNGLIFVPLLTSFQFTRPPVVLNALFAFASFCLIASANYLINDLLDLENDRLHPEKQNRPLAAGLISTRSALAASAVLFVLGVALAVRVGPLFVMALVAYSALTLLYSIRLKRMVFVDVVTLACLYTVRIIAGAFAVAGVLTSWLLAFSMFIFLSLALVKRCAELVLMEEAGRPGTSGRGYLVRDLRVLWPLGTGAALCSVVIFGLYISAEETRARYASPNLIWFVGIGLIYWLGRIWIKTSRGEMRSDPIVFALSDRTSQFVIAFMIAATIAAYVVRF